MQHHMRQWISKFDGLFWTINGTCTAVPAFVRIFHNNDLLPFFVLRKADDVQWADLRTGSAFNTFFFVNDWWHTPTPLSEKFSLI